MDIKATKLLGLNITANPKDLQDHELSDMTNLRLTKQGELKRRFGLRPVNASRLENYYPDENADPKIQVIKNTSRIKYKQVYTASREYLDIFAIDNKVWTYDEDVNQFNLLYEAPGDAEVDIEKYLGFILITSHDSNLAIIKKHARSVFLLHPGSKIIRSDGAMSGAYLDFTTNDEITDSKLKDMDLDQVNLYSLGENSGNNISSAVSPSGKEISGLDWSGNTHFNNVHIFVGHDKEYKGDAIHTTGKGIIPGTLKLKTDYTKEIVRDVDDLYEDGYAERDIITKVKHDFRYNRLDAGVGVYSGLLATGARSWGEGIIKDEHGYEKKFIAKSDRVDYTLYFAEKIDIFYYTEFGVYKVKDTRKNVLYTEESAYNWDILDDNEDYFKQEDIDPGWRHYYLRTFGDFKVGYAKEGEGFRYYNRLIDRQFHHIIYVAKLEGETEKEQQKHPKDDTTNENNVFTDLDSLFGSTYYKVDLTVSTLGATIPAFYNKYLPIVDEEKRFSAEFVEAFEDGCAKKTYWAKKEDLIAYDGVDRAINKIKLFPFLPYYRVESIYDKLGKTLLTTVITAVGGKKYTVPDFIIADKEVLIEKTQEKITAAPIILSLEFDIAFNNEGKNEENGEKDYTLTPVGTDISFLINSRYVKDNLDLSNVLHQLYVENPSQLGMAKNENIFLYIKDENTNPYLVVLKNEIGIRVLATRELDVTNYGTFISIKSFTSHLGQQYIALLMDDWIWIFRLKEGNITKIDELDISAYDIKDIAFFPKDTNTLVYAIQDKADSTVMFKLIDDTEGEVLFDDFSYDEDNGMDYWIHTSTDFPNAIAFVRNEANSIVLLTDNRAAIVVEKNNRNLEFKIDGVANVDYTKVLSDATLSGIQHIKPRNTPPKPVITTQAGTGTITVMASADGGNSVQMTSNGHGLVTGDIIVLTLTQYAGTHTITRIDDNDFKISETWVSNDQPATWKTQQDGKFLYFYVIKEYDSAGNILYESYPAEFSVIIKVATKQITLTSVNGYIPFTDNQDHMYAFIYRTEISNNDKPSKLTDFYEIYNDTDTLTLTDGDSDGVYDIPEKKDTTQTLDTVPRYRGYTDYYPRCKFVSMFNNIAYLGNDTEYPNNIYWSDIFDPSNWRPQNTLATEAFTNDPISGLAPNDGMYIFTRDSVTVANGDGINIVMQNITREIGCVDHRTLQLIAGFLVFLSEKGFYAIRGYKYDPIDIPMSEITHKFTFGHDIITYYDSFTQEYRIMYDNNKIISYSIPLKTWFKFEYPYERMMIGFSRENRITDIPENVMIVRNEQGDTNVYRMLVEDSLISTDFLRGESTGTETQKIVSTLYTKAYEMDNAFAEKVWRRIFIDTYWSHEIDAYISNDNGEFTQIVQQRKRDYFKEVPLIWFRFEELFGNKVVDFGTRGIFGLSFDVLKNQDGKIGKCYKFEDGAYCNIKDIPSILDATITFWFKSIENSKVRQCILSDGKTTVETEYKKEDFTNGLDDTKRAVFVKPLSSSGYVGVKSGNYQWREQIGHSAYSSSGTQQNLNTPNGLYDTSNNFVPASNSLPKTYLVLGDNQWENLNAPGATDIWNDFSSGTYGTMFFYPVGSNWATFAAAGTNGEKIFKFPLSANGDDLGGFVEYYYQNAAWVYAFNGNQSFITIAQNGSIYKNACFNIANLVIRLDGKTGTAGAAAPDVTHDLYVYVGQSLGTEAGTVRFITDGQWNSFESYTSGMYDIVLPDGADGTETIEFYYDETTWTAAFNGNNSDIIINKLGDIYKGVISRDTLVVDHNGTAGIAGGGSLKGETRFLTTNIYVNDTIQDNLLHLYINEENNNLDFGCGDLTYNSWQHATIVINDSTKIISLYINGVYITNSSYTNYNLFEIIADALLAKHKEDDEDKYGLNGYLDDFRIYNSSLTAQQVEDIYNWGRQYLQFEKKTYVVPKGVHKGRSAKFKFISDDYMQVRQIGMEYNMERIR